MKSKKLDSLAKLEAEKQSKYLAGQQAEELEAMGQDSEKEAAKWVIEKGEQERKEEEEQTAVEEWKLHDKRNSIWTYKDVVLDCLKRQMKEAFGMLPRGFLWYPVKTEKGIALYFRDPKGTWYVRGMYVSMIPEYDLNCIDRLIDKALNSMDQIEQAYEQAAAQEENTSEKKTESGIILP
jgi:hypothetical protein